MPKAGKYTTKRTARSKTLSGPDLTYIGNGSRFITEQFPLVSYSEATTSQSQAVSIPCIELGQSEQVADLSVSLPTVQSANLIGVPPLRQLTVPSSAVSKVSITGTAQLSGMAPRLNIKVPGDDMPRQVIAKDLSGFGISVVSPNSRRVLLLKPTITVANNTASVNLTSSSAVEKPRPGCRLVLNDKQWIGTSQTSGPIVARPLLPKGFLFNQSVLRPVSTSLNVPANRQTIQPPPRLIVKTRMLIFNRPTAPKKTDASSTISGPYDSNDQKTDRESPLSCLEQLVANAGADMSKAISDVEFGTEEAPMSGSGNSGLELRSNIDCSQPSPPTPLDLTLKYPHFQSESLVNVQSSDKPDVASKSRDDGCSHSTDGDELSQIQASGSSDETYCLLAMNNGTLDSPHRVNDKSELSRSVVANNLASSAFMVIANDASEEVPSRSLGVSIAESASNEGTDCAKLVNIMNASSCEAELEDSLRWCEALSVRKREPNQLTDEGRRRKKMRQC